MAAVKRKWGRYCNEMMHIFGPTVFYFKITPVCESKNSTNELDFLAVVWALEHFRFFVKRTGLSIVTYHKAFSLVLKGTKDTTFWYNLTRWVDTPLPFQFCVINLSGGTKGIPDGFARRPSELEGRWCGSDFLWNNCFTVSRAEKIDCIFLVIL